MRHRLLSPLFITSIFIPFHNICLLHFQHLSLREIKLSYFISCPASISGFVVVVQLRADQISTLSTNGEQNTVMAGEGPECRDTSLHVYVAVQKAENVRRGRLLPGAAEIRNTNNSNYILNYSL